MSSSSIRLVMMPEAISVSRGVSVRSVTRVRLTFLQALSTPAISSRAFIVRIEPTLLSFRYSRMSLKSDIGFAPV